MSAIADADIPRAAVPLLQHAIDTYASEINKLDDVWRRFASADLDFKPHERSATVRDIMKHELLSARRFFAQFLGFEERAAEDVQPPGESPESFAARMAEMARPRLAQLASRTEAWWLEAAPFFDVERQRIWIFWRRVLHTAHHRTQLAVYLRLLNKPVPAIYGPTADALWEGADPTVSVDAAKRR